MNIYDFFHSEEIAVHCKKIGHIFNPLEMAIIVYLSNKPIKQKHEAYHQIINKYPDMPIRKSHNFNYRCSLHEYLFELMEYENRSIQAITKAEEGAIFNSTVLHFLESGLDSFDVGYYLSSYEKAKKVILDQWNCDKDKVVNGYITKNAIDQKSKYQCAYVDQNGEITSVENFDENKPDLLDMIFFHLPVPFEKGDLVTFGDGKPYIVKELPQWRDDGKTKYDDYVTGKCGDGSDMRVGVFIMNEDMLSSDFGIGCMTWKMSCYEGELKGQERFLKYLGEFIKGKNDNIDRLIAIFMKYYTEKQSTHWGRIVSWYY